MTGKEIYEIWAPENKKWVDWIRPVPFKYIDSDIKKNEVSTFNIPNIENCFKGFKNIALILDFPGYKSIEDGIALIKYGYRPIPIYNGTLEQDGSIPTTDNYAIKDALIWGASEIHKMEIEENAFPVFLLDSNRTNRYKMKDSIFDNSWDIYRQDLPSSDYFKNNDIKNIIVVGEQIQKDLKKILYFFQKDGINIFFSNKYSNPLPIKVRISNKEIIEGSL